MPPIKGKKEYSKRIKYGQANIIILTDFLVCNLLLGLYNGCMDKIKSLIKPFTLAVFFSSFVAGLYGFGVFEYLKWEVWKEIHLDIKSFVSIHIGISLILAVIFYILAIITFIPGLLLLDLLVGYMFPQWLGILIITLSSTLGALSIVWAARFGFKNFFSNTDNKLFQKIQKGFLENETLYLLFVRFMPVFPFALVSMALSSLPISYKKIAWTTFIGMVPVAFLFTTVGSSLGDLIKMDTMPTFSQILTPLMMASIFCLCFVCFLPLIVKQFKRS
jgi:uncharacterized membrane protein YdjX (TVP38/TMEM64 family)